MCLPLKALIRASVLGLFLQSRETQFIVSRGSEELEDLDGPHLLASLTRYVLRLSELKATLSSGEF